MNLRIDPDASLLTASKGPRRSGATHAHSTSPSTEQRARSAGHDATVLTSSRPATTGQLAALHDAAAAAEAGNLSQSQILAAPEAAVQAQANPLPEAVLRLLQ